MADFGKIDNAYGQVGPACVLISYSLIMNYFSGNTVNIEEVSENFIKSFGKQVPQNKNDREIELNKLYHNENPENIQGSGFEKLAHWHKNNRMQTAKLCAVKCVEAGNTAYADLDINIKNKLKDSLKNGDTLAMILCDVGFGKYHAIVYGYDDKSKKYWIRNPEKCNGKLLYEDNNNLLSQNGVKEFILFERNVAVP